MRAARAAGLLFALAALLGASAPQVQVQVPQAQIDAVNAHWKALGVKLPAGGLILRKPYAAPYSNRSFVVPFAWYQQFYRTMRAHHDDPVDASLLRRDLPTLHFLMQKTYAGYGTAAKRGFDWTKWFAAWDKQLAAYGHKRIPLREAFAPLAQLEQVQPDNHTGVPTLKAFTSGSVSAQLDSEPHAACTVMKMSDGKTVHLDARDAGQQPHRVMAWNGSSLTPAWYVSYPQRDGRAASLRCGSSTIALRMTAQPRAEGAKPVYASLGDGIAYLRMPTFTDANDDALRKVLSQAQGLGKERVLILDLRGNDGGNAPTDVLTNWFAESAIELAAAPSNQYGTQSCFRNALFFGLQQQLAAGVKPPPSPGLTQFLQQVAGLLGGPSNCRVEPVVQRGQRSLADHHFAAHEDLQGQTRVLAVVDNGCASDCEYMVYALSGLPGTVIAGTSTFGVMGFTQPGYFVLPYSRIPFRLALSRTDAYGDGRSVDGYGITVDVLLPTTKSESRKSLFALAKRLM